MGWNRLSDWNLGITIRFVIDDLDGGDHEREGWVDIPVLCFVPSPISHAARMVSSQANGGIRSGMTP